MNAVIGMTGLARKTNDLNKISCYLEKIDENSHRLMNLINDVLDMSKIESGKFIISENAFNYAHMIENSANVISDKVAEKNIELKICYGYNFSKMVWADELRLSQIIVNLLANAVKFTPDNGKITIFSDVIEDKNQEFSDNKATLYVEVTDTGIGISEAGKEKLFNPFEQADKTITRQYGGTGLGLAICRQIINLMGGEIKVESEIGKGSKFIFEVPFEWRGEIRLRGDKRTSSDDVRVLVVDDETEVTEYFQEILKNYYINCEAADNGKAAVEMSEKAHNEKKSYDIAFIDYNMPEMSGADVAKVLNKISPETKICVISAHSWDEIREYFKDIKVDFMPKPIPPSDIYNKIMRNIVFNAESSPVYDFSGKRILLVEDIEINRLIVTSLLEDTKVEIDETVNGEDAVQKFKSGDYDLVLMDMQMPVMDGLTATKIIRNLEKETSKTPTPIIAMTANAFKEDAEACLAAGMNDHIAKPIDTEKFMRILSYYFSYSGHGVNFA
jgi:CheY-like chemotaxis protein